MEVVVKEALRRFGMKGYHVTAVPSHEGGRNRVFILKKGWKKTHVLRLSSLGDRTEEDYLAETEFVRYLAAGGASVADVLTSADGRLVEKIGETFASVFAYAPGMLIADNGYRYRKGAPLSEYFYNTGKTLGKIHALSKTYRPVHRRADYFDKYDMAYIDRLIPDDYTALKAAIAERLERFRALPRGAEDYGPVHFDFSDGNYHVDMNTGRITVFDFDNCINCWYLFDLANLWTHGVGWCRFERDPKKRRTFMADYFAVLLNGYRGETDVSEALLAQLPLFIDMVLIENVVDEFECCERAGETVDGEDIREAADALVRDLPYAGFFEA